MGRIVLVLAAVLASAAAPGCNGRTGSSQAPAPPVAEPMPLAFALASPSFTDGATLPKDHTCDGSDIPPALRWSDTPRRARSLALVAHDPDVPAGTGTHWLLWNIDPRVGGLQAGGHPLGGPREERGLPGTGWRGPCPRPGEIRRCRFRLYALDTVLELPAEAGELQLHAAMFGHVLAESVLTVTARRAAIQAAPERPR